VAFEKHVPSSLYNIASQSYIKNKINAKLLHHPLKQNKIKLYKIYVHIQNDSAYTIYLLHILEISHHLSSEDAASPAFLD